MMPLRETFKISARKSGDRPRRQRTDGQVRGEACTYAKLNDDIVRRIRALKKPGVGAKKIRKLLMAEGIEVKVCDEAINDVTSGTTWRHVR